MHFGRLAGTMLVSCAIFAAGVGGRSVAQTTTEVHGSPPPASDADVILDADVHIRSIRFQTVPKNAHVTVSGVNQHGGYRVVRTNLPAHPQAGTTYRDVRIQLQAASRFVDPAHPIPTVSPTPARRR